VLGGKGFAPNRVAGINSIVSGSGLKILLIYVMLALRVFCLSPYSFVLSRFGYMLFL